MDVIVKKKPGLPSRLTPMQMKFAELLVYFEGRKYAYECAIEAGYAEGKNALGARVESSRLQNPDKIWDINKNVITEEFEGKKIVIKQKPLSFLNNLINNFNSKIPDGVPKMAAMLVGYFSYDVIRYVEKIPDKCIDDLKIPDVRLSRPKNLIIYDNLKKKIFFIENIYAESKVKNYFEKYQ